MSAGTTSGVALLLALAALGAGWHVEAAPARAGDIVLDSTNIFLRTAKGYIEVRSPDGALRGKVNFPRNSELLGTALGRKLAFTLFFETEGIENALYVSSTSGSTYKIVATLRLPPFKGAGGSCGYGSSIAAAGTGNPAVTELYLELVCEDICPGTGEDRNYIAVLRYSSATKKLTGPTKVFPLFDPAKCAKKQESTIYVPSAPAIVGGVPYVVAERGGSPNPLQLYKLTTKRPVALGAKLNLPRLSNSQTPERCTDTKVAGAASFYATCDTGKRIGKNRQLPQFAVYQFRRGMAPRIVGRLPARTSVYGFGFSENLLATTPSANRKVGRVLYVIGTTLVSDVGGVVTRFNIFSLDKTKIESPFRQRWQLPQSLDGSVILKLVP